jgi:hypothetical protein
MPTAGNAMLGHRVLSGDRVLRSNPAWNPAGSGEIPDGSAAVPTSAGESAVHEQGRADLWALIGALLLQPSRPLLESLAQAPALPVEVCTGLASAWLALIQAARVLGPETVQRDHAALFVAVGTPLIDPYASRYLGGFLMDEPLARLRARLRLLGLARQRGAARPTPKTIWARCAKPCACSWPARPACHASHCPCRRTSSSRTFCRGPRPACTTSAVPMMQETKASLCRVVTA